MRMHCTDSANELLTPKLKQFLAERIVQRFREHRRQLDGIVLLDFNLFQDLMSAALTDAELGGLVDDTMKQPLSLLLVQDDDFFSELRWNIPPPESMAQAS